MNSEAVEQYYKALRAGQKYYKAALGRGSYPYPPVLDELLGGSAIAGYRDLGLVNIPAELIAGTKTAGRVSALAGNFMPLLSVKSEFAAKWIRLCDAQLGDEGIRDPIKCYEYMGRFYAQEGNKRVSVLKSLGSPTIPGTVTRIVPQYSDDEGVRAYYEFMDFYALSGLYGVEFRRPGGYAKLQAALGFEADHVWTDAERRSFQAGFAQFRKAFDAQDKTRGGATAAEALLVWLQVFPFADIKTQPPSELAKSLAGLWPDIEAQSEPAPIELSTQPDDREKSLLSKLAGVARPDHLNVAFLYAFDPADSVWTKAHDLGRAYLEERLGDRVSVSVYRAYDQNYLSAMEGAVEDGAQLLFATTPAMISACRNLAARHSDVKILNCSLSQPYKGVRTYYSRIHECKYVTGAIAGAMAENDVIGYVANYPIFSVPASINAFALGVRLTNPRARIRLVWSCTPGDPLRELTEGGVTVISNRDAAEARHAHWALEWGTYKRQPDGTLLPLAAPCWNWGRLYERMVLGIFSGAWDDVPKSKAVNYWWGMDSGVIDVKLGDSLPDGVRSLAWILKNGVIDGSVTPYQSRIVDQNGVLRNDGSRPLTHEEILSMDWLCDNVDGEIPGFDAISPKSQEIVRQMGLYREYLPPEKEEKQL